MYIIHLNAHFNPKNQQMGGFFETTVGQSKVRKAKCQELCCSSPIQMDLTRSLTIVPSLFLFESWISVPGRNKMYHQGLEHLLRRCYSSCGEIEAHLSTLSNANRISNAARALVLK